MDLASIYFTIFFFFLISFRYTLLYTMCIFLFHVYFNATIAMTWSCLLTFLLVLLSYLTCYLRILVYHSWSCFFRGALNRWGLDFSLLCVSAGQDWGFRGWYILKLVDLYFLCGAALHLHSKRSFNIRIFSKATTTGELIDSCNFLNDLYLNHDRFLKKVHDGSFWDFFNTM